MRHDGAQEWEPVLREIGKQKRRMEEQSIEDCARYLKDAGAEELRRDGMRLTFRLPDVRETEGSALDAKRARLSDGGGKQNSLPDTGNRQFSLQICGDRVILSRLLMLEPGQVSQKELRSIFRQSDLRRGRLAADILKMNRYVFCLEQTKEGQCSPGQNGMGR